MSYYNNSNQPGSEYDNAAIWSSALREIFLKIGKRPTDTLVIESLFGIPPLPAFKFVAQKMIEADAALNGGANASAICSAMTSRGILATSECFAAPRGEWTFFTSPAAPIDIPDAGAPIESSIFISDARAVDRVSVRVDTDHPGRRAHRRCRRHHVDERCASVQSHFNRAIDHANLHAVRSRRHDRLHRAEVSRRSATVRHG